MDSAIFVELENLGTVRALLARAHARDIGPHEILELLDDASFLGRRIGDTVFRLESRHSRSCVAGAVGWD